MWGPGAARALIRFSTHCYGASADPAGTRVVVRSHKQRFEGPLAVFSCARGCLTQFVRGVLGRPWRPSAGASARVTPCPHPGPPFPWGATALAPSVSRTIRVPRLLRPPRPPTMTRGKSANDSRRRRAQRNSNTPLLPPSPPCTCEGPSDHLNVHAPTPPAHPPPMPHARQGGPPPPPCFGDGND